MRERDLQAIKTSFGRLDCAENLVRVVMLACESDELDKCIGNAFKAVLDDALVALTDAADELKKLFPIT